MRPRTAASVTILQLCNGPKYDELVRRVWATLLLATIGYWLIVPLILAGPDANLPACCRRNGAHHCAMAMDDGATGPAFQATPERCPAFPVTTTAPVRVENASLGHAVAVFAALAAHPTAPRQTKTRYYVSFSRSWHKRGPPVLL